MSTIFTDIYRYWSITRWFLFSPATTARHQWHPVLASSAAWPVQDRPEFSCRPRIKKPPNRENIWEYDRIWMLLKWSWIKYLPNSTRYIRYHKIHLKISGVHGLNVNSCHFLSNILMCTVIQQRASPPASAAVAVAAAAGAGVWGHALALIR